MNKELIREALNEGVIVPDGHTLFSPEKYTKYFDVEQMGLVRSYSSDGTHKGSIYQNGELVQELKDVVYNLDFLYVLQEELGLPYPKASGRGFQAQEIVDSLKAWVSEES